MVFTTGTGHDETLLKEARLLVEAETATEILDTCRSLEHSHCVYRDRKCLNLIAAEAPTSLSVRRALSSSLGYRASGGQIGPDSRCFQGSFYIDKIEALAIELLKKLFQCDFADHRLMGGLAACNVVYSAFAPHGARVMSLSQSSGGDSSNLKDGPPGLRGAEIIPIPFDKQTLTIDLERFYKVAERYKPTLVAIGETATLFPQPVREIVRFIKQWNGKLYFDAAHQAGLIAAGVYPNPLKNGADIITGSGGKTFSGPQSGLILWNNPTFSEPVTHTIFPVLTGSHQINRVYALIVSALELMEFGQTYLSNVVKNAKYLAKQLCTAGLKVLGKEKGYTQTHQLLIDVSKFGNGIEIARKLEKANIIVNKMLIPADSDTQDAVPHGIRLGLCEVTRRGMGFQQMEQIADFITDTILKDDSRINNIKKDVINFLGPYEKIYYSFEEKLPPQGSF